jgi:hypothetical protein
MRFPVFVNGSVKTVVRFMRSFATAGHTGILIGSAVGIVMGLRWLSSFGKIGCAAIVGLLTLMTGREVPNVKC